MQPSIIAFTEASAIDVDASAKADERPVLYEPSSVILEAAPDSEVASSVDHDIRPMEFMNVLFRRDWVTRFSSSSETCNSFFLRAIAKYFADMDGGGKRAKATDETRSRQNKADTLQDLSYVIGAKIAGLQVSTSDSFISNLVSTVNHINTQNVSDQMSSLTSAELMASSSSDVAMAARDAFSFLRHHTRAGQPSLFC